MRLPQTVQLPPQLLPVLHSKRHSLLFTNASLNEMARVEDENHLLDETGPPGL